MAGAKKDDYDFSRIATRLLDDIQVKIWEGFVRRIWERAGYEIPVAEIVRAYFGFEELKHLSDADRDYIRAESLKPVEQKLQSKPAGHVVEHKHRAGRKKSGD